VTMGQHDAGHMTPIDRVDDWSVVVGGVEHEYLTVVADDPDVVRDLPLAAVEREDPGGRDELDPHLEHHHAAEDLATLHLVERFLHSVEADRLRHEPVEVETALQVEVDQHREVA
jgi:hypothetical protein